MIVEIEPITKEKDLSHPPDDQRRRIVQTENTEKTDIPKKDSFLGSQNQVVDRETVSKQKQVTIGSSNQKPSTPQEAEQNTEPKTLSKLGIQMFKSKTNPDLDQPDWATPGLRPQDYIEGMKESDRTALNTSEYRFYTYFQRIRERLDRAWVPILREKLTRYYHAGRQLASDMDHTTKVLVVLNQQGEITRVQLLGESGVHDLDDAAVAAFNKAGPFPNPPQGMMDVRGEIKIPWDFILKT